jgi:hypothetical protein
MFPSKRHDIFWHKNLITTIRWGGYDWINSVPGHSITINSRSRFFLSYSSVLVSCVECRLLQNSIFPSLHVISQVQRQREWEGGGGGAVEEGKRNDTLTDFIKLNKNHCACVICEGVLKPFWWYRNRAEFLSLVTNRRLQDCGGGLTRSDVAFLRPSSVGSSCSREQ